jgi:hypothetical protein
VSDAEPALAVAQHFVGRHRRADGAHEGERHERRDHERSRDQGEQGDRADRPAAEEPAGRSVEEGDVAEQERPAPPQSATAGTVSSSAWTWRIVVFRPRAKSTIPATSGR